VVHPRVKTEQKLKYKFPLTPHPGPPTYAREKVKKIIFHELLLRSLLLLNE
jgi:hypothetical protein